MVSSQDNFSHTGRHIGDDNGAGHQDIQAAALSSFFHHLMAHSICIASRRCCSNTLISAALSIRHFTASALHYESQDPRVSDLGPTIKDDYANIRAKYRVSPIAFLL